MKRYRTALILLLVCIYLIAVYVYVAQDFRHCYNELWKEHIKKGLNLGQLKRTFKEIDEDHDRKVTVEEFRHGIRRYAAHSLTHSSFVAYTC